MARHSVDIVLQAHDNATKVFKQVEMNLRGTMRSIGRVSVIGVSVRGFEGLTDALVQLRDRNIGTALTAFVEKIPIIGHTLNRIGENLAELFVNTNAQIRESNELLKEQKKIGDSINLILAQRKTIEDKIALIKTPQAEKAVFNIARERAEQLKAVEEQEAIIRRMWARGEGETRQMLNLLKSLKEQKKLIEDLYRLRMIEEKSKPLEEKRREIELSDLAKQKSVLQEIESIYTRTREIGYSEFDLLKKRMREAGISEDIMKRTFEDLGKIQKWEKDQKAAELYKNTVELLNKEIALHKKDIYESIIYEMVRAGVLKQELATVQRLIDKRREQLRVEVEPTRGWTPFISETLKGMPGRTTADYQAQIAAQTREANVILRHIQRSHERMLSKMSSGAKLGETEFN